MWNKLVKILYYPNIDAEDKKMAQMFLNQLNTASGKYFLRKEIETFIENVVSKHSDILTYKEDELKKLMKEKEDFEKNFVVKRREDFIFREKKIKEFEYKIKKLK